MLAEFGGVSATWNLFVLYNKEFKNVEKVLIMTSSIRLSSTRS